MKRTAKSCLAFVLAAFLVQTPVDVGMKAGSPPPRASLTPPNRPNILILVSDDQQMATFDRTYMPSVFSQLVDKGVHFSRFYVNSSLCCPSRSEIFTGLNEQHTGVDDNNTALYRPTIIEALHDLGYRTMLSGKYLNSSPCDPRPEFDEWVCQFQNSDNGLSLVNPTLNVNGAMTSFTGYTTQIEANFVADFIGSTPIDQPFFALYTPTAPHLPANDPRYGGMPIPAYRPPNYDEETRTDGKPFYMQRPPMPAAEIARNDQRFAKMARTVRSLDDDIGHILASLGSREEDTLVFFLSDNGFLLGEHRREAKMVPYEESTHVPFVVRYPAANPVTEPFSSDALVSNIDIAPTIAEVVGIPWGADGASVLPLLTRQATSIREALLLNWCRGIHECPGNKPSNMFIEPSLSIPSYFGVVAGDHKYVEYRTGEEELYDLQQDPYELVNHAGEAAYADIHAQLAATLAQLTAAPPVDTTIVTGPEGVVQTRAFTIRYFSQSRLSAYQCRLDKDGDVGTWMSCNGETKVVGPLGDGDYVFQVEGTDELGTSDPTPASRSFSIHSTGPDVRITSAPATHRKKRWVRFRFSSQTQGVTFECRLGIFGGTPPAWSACRSGDSFGSLADATWSFEVRAVDGDGMATSIPALWLFQVDNTGPTILFDSAPVAQAVSTTATFTFHPNEPTVGTITCLLDANAGVDCSGGSFVASGLSHTDHTLSITATDTLGNVGTTSYTWHIT